MPLSLPDFIARWQAATLSERSAAQSHFNDLCDLLGQPKPAEADPTGAWYTFEKGVSKTGGGQGFADVWMRGHFAWEYKGKHKNLDAAYRQLLQYKEDLENPPLLVVCDLDRFEVHTNFTNTIKRVYSFSLADLASTDSTPSSPLPPLEVLRALFTDPNRLRPDRTAAEVTEEAAARFGLLAQSLHKRGADPEEAAHFLMRLLFCLFAEDIRLLPPGLFSQLVERTRKDPEQFNALVEQLFEKMATGGWFGVEKIAHFNGGLFADSRTLELTSDDLSMLSLASKLDWASVEPAIFGTLFERSLDPSKRAQLGAHYTSKEDILLIVEPVLMEPLRRRWAEVQAQAHGIIERRNASMDRAARTRYDQELSRVLWAFTDEIASTRVLDPACGSGNFLYVALKRLLDLEKEVSVFAASNGLPGMFVKSDPSQLYGIEINPYAYELASVVVWIGYIQWLRDNGFGSPTPPILKRLDNIKHMDAILAYDEQGKPVEPEWPEADVIIGNPPFLGGSKIRRELGDAYVNDLWSLYSGRIASGSDLVCYWIEEARDQLSLHKTKRVGLLATQSIRSGISRKVLERVKHSGNIFWAISDRQWVLDGASVHVSMIGFDNGAETNRELDGRNVQEINADLTGSVDLTAALPLRENMSIAFSGSQKGGPFEIPYDLAKQFISSSGNPNGRSNDEVIKPSMNALDMMRRSRGMWIIDFGVNMPVEVAAEFEKPFEFIKKHVYPVRVLNRRPSYAAKWWQHIEAGPAMRIALAKLERYIVTPRVSKHRVFAWLTQPTLPDYTLMTFAREDDYFFGVLHSIVHELWVRATGTQLRELESGLRYTPINIVFEAYPFPWPPGKEPQGDPRVEAIADAARELVRLRDNWLNPPDASEADLKKRTLTNLYNLRPTWLDNAHRRLDRAVLDAYGWAYDLTDEQILERLLALNLERAKGLSSVPRDERETSDE
jgi:type II restriction/modification system DNA methylase subunit YeeA